MSTPTFWKQPTFFYPFGNTPAYSLAQYVAGDESAAFLLLGAGDMRHLLYTAYAAGLDEPNSSRTFDFTLVDTEPAVLGALYVLGGRLHTQCLTYVSARNTLLVALLAKDMHLNRMDDVWSIFYDLKISDTTLELALATIDTLVTASSSLEAWNAITFGTHVRVRTEYTLRRLHAIFTSWASTRSLSKSSAKNYLTALRAKADKMIPQMTQGLNITAFRSAGPNVLQLNPNIGPELYRSFWKTGVASLDSRIINAARHPNTTLRFALSGESFPVHHGCLPALGFHLGEALLQAPNARKVGVEEVHRVVREQFGRWCKAFGTAVKASRIIIRMCVGEALHVCRALGGRAEGRLFTGSWSAEPLFLLDDGPRVFHAIEVSNLEDQLGLINVLCRAPPLLAHVPVNSRTTPVIFSETLMTQPGEFVSSFRTNILGEPSFIALALGVVPVPYIHGFTSEYFGHHIMTNKVAPLAAQYTRIVWQATPHLDASTKLHFPEPADLASVLHDVYYAMFAYEDVVAMRSAIQFASKEAQIVVQRRATLLLYTRKSFVEFLCSLARRVSNRTDWSSAMNLFVGLVGADRRLIIGGNHYQDLCALLVDSGLDMDVVPMYDERRVPDMVYLSATPFEGWGDEELGRVVWAALRVPVSAMSQLTGVSPAPGLQLNQRAPKALNYFTSIQVFRGRVARSADERAFAIVSSANDTADIVVVGRMPAWILLTDIANTTIALGAMVNGLSAPTIMQKLGMNMEIFSASASDASRVFFGSEVPSVDGVRIGPPIDKVLQPLEELPADRIEVTLDASTGAVATLNVRRDVEGNAARSRWTEQAVAEVNLSGPTSGVVRTSCGTFEASIGFPLPVSPAFKLRVARKSFYVEIVATLAKVPQPSSGLFRSLLLSRLPLLPTSPRSRFDFVDMHGQFAFSDAERHNRDAHINRSTHARPLVEVKDDIFTILMRSCGFIDNRPDPVRIFALLDRDKGQGLDGVHALVFVDGLRLDVEGNTLVLDSYVLPWAARNGADVPNAGTTGDIPHPRAAAELWDKLLVSFVERCRTWSHAPSCTPSARLCPCGAGADIAGFVANAKWKVAFGLKSEIYRAAIALPFAAHYLATVGGHMPDIKSGAGLGTVSPSRMLGQRTGDAYSAGISLIPRSTPSTVKHAPTPPFPVSLAASCASCGNDSATLACGRCGKVRYCNKNCQLAHWAKHKTTCS